MNTRTATAILSLVVVLTAGCGDSDPKSDVDPGSGDAPAACPVDDPTCYETGTEDAGG